MNGSYVAARVASAHARAGEAMTLTRIGGASVTVPAKRFGSAAETVVNSQTRTTFSVSIAEKHLVDAGWPTPPQKKDSLAVGGRTYKVEEVNTLASYGGVVARHVLKVTG